MEAAAAAAARPPARPPSGPAAIMLALISRLLDWFRSLFWKEEMELTLVGLQYSGKTTFVNVIAVRTAAHPRGCGRDSGPRGGLGRRGRRGALGWGWGPPCPDLPDGRDLEFPACRWPGGGAEVGGWGVMPTSSSPSRGCAVDAAGAREGRTGAGRVSEALGGLGFLGVCAGGSCRVNCSL